MMLYENIRLALFSLVANKMRALLTMLGIIIGIASVIAIMTVGNSVTQEMTDSMASLGANNVTVMLQQKEEEEESTKEGVSFGRRANRNVNVKEADMITKEMISEYVEKYGDSITAISASQSVGQGQIKDGNLYANVSVSGASTGVFIANDTDMVAGRFFTEREMDDASMVAIVSDKVVDNMFKSDKEAAIGKEITIYIGERFYKFVVVGVYEYEQSPYMISTTSDKDKETALYIPLKTGQNLAHNENFASFTVVTKADTDPDAFAKTTGQFFNAFYRKNRNWQISAFSMASMVDIMSTMMGSLTTAISVIAGIALLVGGIGVMNIMLVSITERTREIGTRKALGAPNSSIRVQFIVESIVICVIGGIIGIILGVTAGILLANWLGTPAAPSVSSIVMSITFSMAIGVFFGYYPANKAAKMDPIEALRYE